MKNILKFLFILILIIFIILLYLSFGTSEESPAVTESIKEYATSSVLSILPEEIEITKDAIETVSDTFEIPEEIIEILPESISVSTDLISEIVTSSEEKINAIVADFSAEYTYDELNDFIGSIEDQETMDSLIEIIENADDLDSLVADLKEILE